MACLATVLELDLSALPVPAPDEDRPSGWTLGAGSGGWGWAWWRSPTRPADPAGSGVVDAASLQARLCEPCTVVQGYAKRPVPRELVYRGGLRADILCDVDIRVGDAVAALAAG